MVTTMTLDELERHLELGEQWGYKKETDSSDYLGWVLLSKRQPSPLWERKAYANEEVYLQAKERADRLKKTPYHLRVIELRRDVHESGEYESTEDYRLNENHYCSSLTEAVRLIKNLGFQLENIKWRGELDAP
jgi:hypothetical protein